EAQAHRRLVLGASLSRRGMLKTLKRPSRAGAWTRAGAMALAAGLMCCGGKSSHSSAAPSPDGFAGAADGSPVARLSCRLACVSPARHGRCCPGRGAHALMAWRTLLVHRGAARLHPLRYFRFRAMSHGL